VTGIVDDGVRALGYVEVNGEPGYQHDGIDRNVHAKDTLSAGVTMRLHDNCNNCTCTENYDLECTFERCRQDCVWDEWSEWSSCDRTCGEGKRTRTRTVLTLARNGGKQCSESLSSEVEYCANDPCPPECDWDNWSTWTPCSKSCGGGTKTRIRSCDNSAYPDCKCEPGSSIESDECNVEVCPPDTCTGNKILMENCTNYEHCPSTCMDLSLNSCVEHDCEPGCRCPEGTVENDEGWCVPITECPCYSLDGNIYPANFTVEGECSDCACESGELTCVDKPCTVNCEWSNWTPWTDCSVTCGNGIRVRDRYHSVEASNGGMDCVGDDRELEECSSDLCPVCVDPATGETYNVLETFNETDCYQCYCNTTLQIECYELVTSKTPGIWSSWSDWTTCSATCGTGVQTRTRTCNSPPPKCGGRPCQGPTAEHQECISEMCSTVSLPPTTTPTVCTDPDEEFAYNMCETTCDGLLMMEGNDTCRGNVVISACACQSGLARDVDGNCVSIDECYVCYDENKQPYPSTWEDPSDPCIYYLCDNGQIVQRNATEECAHREDYYLLPADGLTCCNYAPKPTPPPSLPCHLVERQEILYLDDGLGNTWESEAVMTLSSCEGACNSFDSSLVRFKNEQSGDETVHDKSCKCCTGTGHFVPINMKLGDQEREAEVYIFTQCGCTTCESETTAQAEPTCEAITLDYETIRDVNSPITATVSSSESKYGFGPYQGFYGSNSAYQPMDNVTTPAIHVDLVAKDSGKTLYIRDAAFDVNGARAITVVLSQGLNEVQRVDKALTALEQRHYSFVYTFGISKPTNSLSLFTTRCDVTMDPGCSGTDIDDMRIDVLLCSDGAEPAPMKR